VSKQLPTVKSAIKMLQKEGLLKELKGEILDSLLDELGIALEDDIHAVELYVMLDAYYCGTEVGNKTSLRDGYTTYDWQYVNDTDDIAAEFSDVVGKRDWFKLERIEADDVLVIASNKGERHHLYGTDLRTVTEFFNTKLKEEGDKRQFYSLETGGDQYAFIFMSDDSYKRLAKAGILTFEGTEYLKPGEDDYLNEIAAKDSNEPAELVGVGKILIHKGRTEDALKKFTKAIEIYQRASVANDDVSRMKHIEARFQRANILFLSKAFDGALLDLDILAGLLVEPPTNLNRGVASLVLKGRCLTEMGKLKEALAVFNKAIEIDEYEDSAYFYRAQA
jgi:hypothetical protein